MSPPSPLEQLRRAAVDAADRGVKGKVGGAAREVVVHNAAAVLLARYALDLRAALGLLIHLATDLKTDDYNRLRALQADIAEHEVNLNFHPPEIL